jgi:hypothetical protein
MHGGLIVRLWSTVKRLQVEGYAEHFAGYIVPYGGAGRLLSTYNCLYQTFMLSREPEI